MQSRLASIFILGTFLTSAFSATSPMKDEVLYANYNGFYAGLNLGAFGHTLNMTDNQATSFNATIQNVSNPAFLGGFQIGYRRPLEFTNHSGMYGLEFTLDFANSKNTQEYGSPYALYQLNTNNTLKRFYVLEFVGGITASKTLLFLSAGLSWTNIEGSVTNVTATPYFSGFNLNKSYFGGTFGGGVEYACTPHLSLRGKVAYLPSNAYILDDTLGNTFQVSNNSIIGSFGINYSFG